MKFTVYGNPQGKQRHRSAQGGKVMYTPTETKQYQSRVVASYIGACKGLYFDKGIPVSVEIVAVYAIPKSASKKKREQMLNGEILPTKKPDYDNIAKIITDALNGVAFHDDAQVVYSTQLKLYGEIPRVEVDINGVKRFRKD